MIYNLLLLIISLPFRIFFSFRVEGKEKLRQYKKNGKHFVVCPNHRHFLDPLFVLMAWGVGKKFVIMAKAELFRNPLLAALIRLFGAYPVERGKGDHKVIDYAVERVKQGRGMLIFPEGTRGAYDYMARLKSGAFMIAGQTQGDIVPVMLVYPTDTGKLKLFGPIRVLIGDPVPCEELRLETGSKQKIREAKVVLRERMEGMLEDYCRRTGYVPKKREEENTVKNENNNS